MESHCSTSNTPLAIPLAQWMAQASGVSTSTTSAAPTTATVAATSTTTSSYDNGRNTGLSSSAKIAIIAGSAGAGLLLLATALFFCLRYRRRRRRYDQVHSLLLADSQHTGLPLGERATIKGHPEHMSIGPSELDSAANMAPNTPTTADPWHTPSNTSSAPWSPGAFESIKTAQFVGIHPPLPLNDVHEMPADDSCIFQSSFAAAAPVELPTTDVTSPTSTATSLSRYSGVGWVSEAYEDPRRYEPFRPR